MVIPNSHSEKMVNICGVLFLGVVATGLAFPTEDPVIKKLDNGLRYQYMEGPNGLELVDLWMRASHAAEAARYSPDTQNSYHLFTRQNPVVSQPLLIDNDQLLGLTNFNPLRRTIILIHGWRVNVLADMNTVLVPAFLSAEDVNVIVVDWSAGAGSINYATAVANTVTCGEGLARFINWINSRTGATAMQYHLVGHSLGGHMVGIIARNVQGTIGYATGLEPAFPGWVTHDDKLQPDDAGYTEVIHTNAGVLGYLSPAGHVDFYPNGGINMPGCDSQTCDHARSYHYLAESLITGGFTGRGCLTYIAAMTGNCLLWGRLQMGGLVPKTGQTGIYHLTTNAAPPFSQG